MIRAVLDTNVLVSALSGGDDVCEHVVAFAGRPVERVHAQPVEVSEVALAVLRYEPVERRLRGEQA